MKTSMHGTESVGNSFLFWQVEQARPNEISPEQLPHRLDHKASRIHAEIAFIPLECSGALSCRPRPVIALVAVPEQA
jgi:hypothetical protein